MSHPPKKIEWTVWAGLAITIVILLAVFQLNHHPSSSTSARHASSTSSLPVFWKVSDFTLTNHLGAPVSLDSLQGQVWVADIIFTRCPGPCPEMTRRMREIQDNLSPEDPVRLISLTTDPLFDSPDVLKEYANRFGAQPDRWWFLTGPKQQIFQVATNGLKLTALEKSEADRTSLNDLFIHSTIFLVVDKLGRVRDTIESDQEGWKEETLGAIRTLLKE